MSISTRSLFYYGFDVTQDNQYLNFDEGGPELTAQIDIGSYSFTDILTEVQTGLNNQGALTYTVTLNRTTRSVTISATGTFSLLISSGSNASTSIFSTLGFTGADLTGAATYTGAAAGSIYQTQFPLQNYVPIGYLKEKIFSKVNESSSGRIETVSFGTRQFIEGNNEYITNITQPNNGPVYSNATGISDALAFLSFAIDKKPLEFMPDVADPSTFEKVILESSRQSQQGTGFLLEEMVDRNLAGYYRTGLLRFRKVD